MPTTPRDTAIKALADALLWAQDGANAGESAIDYLHHIKPILTPADHADLCIALDVCPVHVCDVEICDDDEEQECEAIRHG